MTVSELYERSVKPLSEADRVELAKLILREVAPNALIDVSDDWSDEDLRDITQASLQRFEDGEADAEN
jgi:hypothetical protein